MRAPISATDAARRRSASRISGRRRIRSTGRSGRRACRQTRYRARPLQTAGNVFGVFADQNGDRVGVGGDLRLEGLDVGLKRLDLTLGKQHVEFIGQPAIEAGLRQIENLPRRLDVAVENLQPVLPRAKIEIETGDVGRDHHIDPVARLLQRLGGIDLRLDAACAILPKISISHSASRPPTPEIFFRPAIVVTVAQALRDPALGFVGAGAGAAADPAIELRHRLPRRPRSVAAAPAAGDRAQS